MEIETTTTTTCTHAFTGMTHAQILLIWNLLAHVRLGEGEFQTAAFEMLEAMESNAEISDLVQTSTVELHARAGEDGSATRDFIIEICAWRQVELVE